MCIKTHLPEQEIPTFLKENTKDKTIIDTRISILETRLNNLEEKILLLEQINQNPETSIVSRNIQNTMMGTTKCIPLVCNKRQLISVKVLVKLNFPKQNQNPTKEEIIQALLDTGCSQIVICRTKVPPHMITKSKHIQKTRTMSGIVMLNDEEISNISLQFSTNCDLFGQKIHIRTMRVENLVPSKQTMIIGLDFILDQNRTITINKDYVIISDKSQMSPIISGDSSTEPSLKECSCTNPESSEKCDCIKEDLEFMDYYPNDIMDSFSSIKISKTITFDNIQQILDRLNKTSIIGEDLKTLFFLLLLSDFVYLNCELRGCYTQVLLALLLIYTSKL